jgi:hypothetical protein
LEPELRELLRRELRRLDREHGVGRDEDRLLPPEPPARQLLRLREVRTLERVDRCVPEPGDDVGEVLVREPRRYRAACVGQQRVSVEREVDGAPQLRVVPEEGPLGVEREQAEREPLLDEEPRQVDAVLLDEAKCRVHEDAGEHVAPVGIAAVDASHELRR